MTEFNYIIFLTKRRFIEQFFYSLLMVAFFQNSIKFNSKCHCSVQLTNIAANNIWHLQLYLLRNIYSILKIEIKQQRQSLLCRNLTSNSKISPLFCSHKHVIYPVKVLISHFWAVENNWFHMRNMNMINDCNGFCLINKPPLTAHVIFIMFF